MVTCPNCGSSVPAATFCQVCGHTLAGAAGAPASTGPLPDASGGGGGSPTVAISPGQTDPLPGPPTFSAPPPPPSYNAQAYSQPGYTPPPSYSPGAYQPPTQQMGQGQPGYASQPPTQYMPPPYQTQQLAQGQGQTSAYPPPYAPYPVVPPANYAPGYPYQQSKDPTIAFVLELIGLFGVLGIGHMYGGRVGRGVGIMFGFWAYLAVSVILTFVVVGCVLLLFSLVIPVLSGLWIKSDLEKERAAMWRP